MMDVLLRILLFHLLTSLGSEIINGKKVPDDLMLYMASVQDSSGRHICGGFLINEDFVVTAAHCRKPTSVVLGTHNLKKINNGTNRYSVETCEHPSYVNVKSGNDIMLLKLSKKAQLGNRIQPVQLPKAETKLKDKTKCRVAGWGLTKTRGQVTAVLQVADVPFVDLEVCKTKWNEVPFTLPNNVICAGGFNAKKGFCRGDSGGPLVCGREAVGVVSFNMKRNCDYPNVPNVYTDISKYLDWIKEISKRQKC
uniref:Peptidase S1 domain-containing protein n=1 Tax=Mola mola TaxID=94237 RepID=A0A3Q3VKL9_MOLML